MFQIIVGEELMYFYIANCTQFFGGLEDIATFEPLLGAYLE